MARFILLSLTLLLPLTAPLRAEDVTLAVRDPNPMQLAGAAATADAAPSTRGFIAAAQNLRPALSAPYTGDADADFLRTLLPLRRSALEMARVELEYGTDPDIRRAARDMMAHEQAEIDRLATLGRH